MVQLIHQVLQLIHHPPAWQEFVQAISFYCASLVQGVGKGVGKVKHFAHSGRCCSRWIARKTGLYQAKLLSDRRDRSSRDVVQPIRKALIWSTGGLTKITKLRDVTIVVLLPQEARRKIDLTCGSSVPPDENPVRALFYKFYTFVILHYRGCFAGGGKL